MLAIVFAIIVTILILIMCKDFYKDFKKFLSLIFIFIITTIFIYVILSHIDFFKNIISQSNYPIYDKFVLLLNSLSIAILIDGIFSCIFQSLYESIIIWRHEKAIKSQDFEYYRDILQTKAPAILSYCYNRKLNIEDEVVAILLNLKKKGIIELEKDAINIIGNINGLESHEKYVLNNIKRISSDKKTFKHSFKTLLFEDLVRKNYAYIPTSEKVNIYDIMGIFIVWMIIFTLVTIPIFMELSQIGFMLFFAYFLTFVCIPIYEAIDKKIHPIVRTKKALKLSGKLKGLKNYIHDYSIIANNGIENINLYDEYVIYAIILNIRGKLNTQCKQIYRNIKNRVIHK